MSQSSVEEVFRTFSGIGPGTVPAHWPTFFQNVENKRQLIIRFILEEWSSNKYIARLQSRGVFYICGADCFRLTLPESNSHKVHCPELCLNHGKANTQIALHFMHICENETSIPRHLVIGHTLAVPSLVTKKLDH